MSAAKPGRKRRSLASLTAALNRARTQSDEARAHYDLGLFHDNNGREAQAIPHYRKALKLGIDPGVVPEALAVDGFHRPRAERYRRGELVRQLARQQPAQDRPPRGSVP